VVEFRIKQDAVPGRWTTLRVTPTELGDFRIRCAELCGYAHSSMYAPVVVVEPQQFEDWLAGKKVEAESPEATTPAAQGAQIAETRGCLSCHSVDGSALVGPSWKGLFGSEVEFEDGSTAIADEAYLRSSILDPAAQIVAGYPNVMPAAYSFLTDKEMAALIEYIKSLSE
jgi:cytochrome c oxidase subunit 2